MGLFSGLGKILKAAAPVAGTALGGPLGAAAGSALSGLIGGSQKAGQGDKNRSQADQIAMQRYQSLAPLRQRALQMAQSGFGGQRPNLAAGFQRGNPYQRPQLGGAAPVAGGIGGAVQPERPSGPLGFGGGPEIGPGRFDAPAGRLGALGGLLASRPHPVTAGGMGPGGMAGAIRGIQRFDPMGGQDAVLRRRDQEFA